MADRTVPAPGLLEVAQTWWDVERVPVVAWNEQGRSFWLVDPEQSDHRLALLELASAAEEPGEVARVLAEGLAACDFPPTGEQASPGRVAATLRAAHRPERPA